MPIEEMKAETPVHEASDSTGSSQMQTSNIEASAKELARSYLGGFGTVVVLGSGVSAGRIPLLGDMIEKLMALTKLNDPKLYGSLRSRLADVKSRESVETAITVLRKQEKIWSQFEDWLWEDGRLTNLKPTEAHTALAKSASLMGDSLRFIEFNFDGLMKRAMEAVSATQNAKALTYGTEGEASRWFSLGEETLPIFEMRGDVLYGECTNSKCPKVGQQLYLFSGIPRTCPSCRGVIKLGLVLPGNTEKYKANLQMLKTLDSWLFPATRTVVVLGFSGHWDDDFVFTLSRWYERRGLKVIEIALESTEFSRFSSVKLIGTRADELVPVLIGEVASQIDSGSRRKEAYSFELAHSPHYIPLHDETIPLTPIEVEAMKTPAFDDLTRVLQLSLKSTALGVRHTRWEHSLGVMALADEAYMALPVDHRPQERQLLRLAALYHDIGHPPLSHLMEEVFEELNWKPGGGFKAFKHEHQAERILSGDEYALLVKKVEDSLYPFTMGDVILASRGELGIPYIDALISSSMDADKMDYVRRDCYHIEHVGGKPPKPTINWKSYVEGLKKSYVKHGYPFLSQEAALEVFHSLQSRFELYDKVYLSSESRWVEASGKQLLLPFFVSLAFRDKFDPDMPLSEFTSAKVKHVLSILKDQYQNDQDKILKAAKDFLVQRHRGSLEQLAGIENAYKATQYKSSDRPPPEILRLCLKCPTSTDSSTIFKKAMNERREVLLEYPWTVVVDLFRFPDFTSIERGVHGERDLVFVDSSAPRPLSFREWVSGKKTPEITQLEGSIFVRCYSLTDNRFAFEGAMRSLRSSLEKLSPEWRDF